jgi:hypothetical protein
MLYEILRRGQAMNCYIFVSDDVVQEEAVCKPVHEPVQPTVYDIIRSDGLLERAGHSI